MVKGISLLSVAVAIIGGVMLPIMFFRAMDRREAPPIVIEDVALDATIVVAVEGAVASPGLVALPAGARWDDAIGASGGLLGAADSSQINLAARVADGEQVIIPTRSVVTQTAPVRASQSPDTADPVEARTAADDGMVNINLASATELDALPGIGPVLAERIVERRAIIGAFSRVDDLSEVQGISPRMVEVLRPLATV